MEASLPLPHAGHSARRRSDSRTFKLPPNTEFICQNHYSDTKTNRSFTWKAFTTTEKLYSHTENIQELEINISEALAVAELGVHQALHFAAGQSLSYNLFHRMLLKYNVIYFASDVLHNTHLFSQGQRENGNQDPEMCSRNT